MRIAILWTALSGYVNACLRELASRDRVELFVSHQTPAVDAPFDSGQFSWIQNRLQWRSFKDLASLEERLREFNPGIMVLPSWHVPEYRRVARLFAATCWRVMTMDHPWLGTLRQRVGVLISPVYVKPLADVVWLPGERQATFARKLGFTQSSILRGLYACDHPRFELVHSTRIQQRSPIPRKFVYVGRFVRQKGIDILAAAYMLYRMQAQNPWPLICCGAGPMCSQLEGKEGIQVRGFVEPDDLPGVFGSTGCLVLPSRFEPWGLVVHEATSAGKLIIASENVGSVPHLVQSGYNGFICSNGNVTELAALMTRISALNDAQLDEMSQVSHLLSLQFSPKRWADTLLESYQERSSILQ